MATQVKIASEHILKHLPWRQHLPSLWRESLLLTNFVKKRRKKCHCDEPYLLQIPIFLPIYPSSGDTTKGTYNSIPIVYISWKSQSKKLAFTEILEVPIFDHQLIFKNSTCETIERSLAPNFSPFIALSSKVTESNLKNDLEKIRISVFRQIFKISSDISYLHFSAFSSLNKLLVENNDSRYLNAIYELENEVSWEFHSQRVLPISHYSHFFIVKVNCWTIGIQELTRKKGG